MSSYRKEIEKIHDTTDFKVSFAGVTEIGEFKYTNGSMVKPELDYHIHYTTDKQEVFMTGGTHNPRAKIIIRVGGTKSLFSRYTSIKAGVKDTYPQNVKPFPEPADYRLGFFTRYFFRKANDPSEKISETSQEFFETKSNLFTYVNLDWVITGAKLDVARRNSIIMRRNNNILSGIIRELDPYQYWRPDANSQEYLEKKLALRRNQFYQ